jgi:hypothetical protein
MTVPEFLEKVLPWMRAYRMLPWMIGDVCLEFEESRGEEAWQYIDEVVDAGEISRDILKDYMRIAETFWDVDDKKRTKLRLGYELSIWKFKEVCNLPLTEALMMLRRARDHGWSTKQLRAEVKARRQGASV